MLVVLPISSAVRMNRVVSVVNTVYFMKQDCEMNRMSIIICRQEYYNFLLVWAFQVSILIILRRISLLLHILLKKLQQDLKKQNKDLRQKNNLHDNLQFKTVQFKKTKGKENVSFINDSNKCFYTEQYVSLFYLILISRNKSILY